MYSKVCQYVLMIYSVRFVCHPPELSKLISARELRPILGEQRRPRERSGARRHGMIEGFIDMWDGRRA
jgi:hypothetical protein